MRADGQAVDASSEYRELRRKACYSGLNPEALITGPPQIRVGLLDPGELLTRGASAHRQAA